MICLDEISDVVAGAVATADSFAGALRATGLFDALTEAEFDDLVRVVRRMDVPSGTTILREGDPADEMYVILAGVVQVFTTLPGGEEIVLRRRQQGEYIGEQALVPGGLERRNASVRAHDDVVLLRIRGHDFQRVLARDSPLKDRLLSIGAEQVRETLRQQSALFRSLDLGTDGSAWSHEVGFADGETVFAEGSVGDACYFIVSGTAAVYRQEADRPTLVARLGAGQCFGELALLRRAPRRATVRAEGPLKLLRIDGDYFLRMHAHSPDVRAYTETLQKVYVLSERGLTTQHTGRFLDVDCITTLHHLRDGTTIMASRVIGQDIFGMSVVGVDTTGAETLRFRDVAGGIERELVVVQGRIVAVTAQGQWDELGDIHRYVLERTLVAPSLATQFRQRGTLRAAELMASYDDDEVVCGCMEVRRGTLRRAIRRGCHTVEALGDAYGAGAVCGGCRFRLRAMVGRVDWMPVVASHVSRVTDDTWTFRFTPCAGALETAKPGQHIMVQAQIDGRWVERPYTLTSANSETAYHEITIKREEHGVFSRWMTTHRTDDALIRISAPQGGTGFDLADQRPVVCLVAGIGMTPALAMCRSIIREGTATPLHIHYSASTRERFAYVDELEAAARDPRIRLTLRATQEEGRLTHADVAALVQEAPDARFYVCGPPAYISAITGHLAAARVPAERITVETFSHAGGAPVPKATRPRRPQTSIPPAMAVAPREDFSAMLYREFVEKVLTKEIVLPQASRIVARLQAEHPELFEPANARMALSAALLVARVGVTAALSAWAASRERYLLVALLWFVQGINYYGLTALVHDFVHDAGFSKGWANRLVGTVFAAPLLLRFTAFRTSHLQHHRANQSLHDPKVTVPSETRQRIFHVFFDRIYSPAPPSVQFVLLLGALVTLGPPMLLLGTELSAFRPMRSRDDVIDATVIAVLWAGAFGLLGWQIAAAVLVGPLFFAFSFLALVFWTHASEHSFYPLEPDPDEYELMIFNITNLTLGRWLDRLGCYLHRYHVEHHLVPTLAFHRLAKVSEFVRGEWGQYMLPVRFAWFQYTSRGVVPIMRHWGRQTEIAGKRYIAAPLFETVRFGGAAPAERRR